MATTYTAHGESLGESVELDASTLAEACGEARDRLDLILDWENGELETRFLSAIITELVDGEPVGTSQVFVTVDPEEPGCTGSAGDHAWISLGRVNGSGCGVTFIERCTLCGLRRTVDTGVDDQSTGRSGLRSVRYTLP